MAACRLHGVPPRRRVVSRRLQKIVARQTPSRKGAADSAARRPAGLFSACALRNPRPARRTPGAPSRSHPHDQAPVCARLFVHWDVEDVFAQVGDVEDNMTKMTSWLGAVLALGFAAAPLSASARTAWRRQPFGAGRACPGGARPGRALVQPGRSLVQSGCSLVQPGARASGLPSAGADVAPELHRPAIQLAEFHPPQPCDLALQHAQQELHQPFGAAPAARQPLAAAPQLQPLGSAPAQYQPLGSAAFERQPVGPAAADDAQRAAADAEPERAHQCRHECARPEPRQPRRADAPSRFSSAFAPRAIATTGSAPTAPGAITTARISSAGTARSSGPTPIPTFSTTRSGRTAMTTATGPTPMTTSSTASSGAAMARRPVTTTPTRRRRARRRRACAMPRSSSSATSPAPASPPGPSPTSSARSG